MDRLIDAIERVNNPSVVGLDPKPALLPEPLLTAARSVRGIKRAKALANAYWLFNKTIIDSISDVVAAVKPQIAMYEALGIPGVLTYVRTAEYAQSKGLYVLGDVKRGDIGSTAAAYASHLSGLPALDTDDDTDADLTAAAASADMWHEDAVTINPYLGSDGITPFVEAAAAHDKDVFVLVRTSNPSSSQLQTLRVSGGESDGEQIAERVGHLVEQWGSQTRGHYGYSRVGAVVGATHPDEGRRLRELLPHTFFLVPGFGAQGGSAADVAAMFDAQGRGAIVNSSRGIIAAWKKDPEAEAFASAGNDDAEAALALVGRCARAAALNMRDSINKELEKRNEH